MQKYFVFKVEGTRNDGMRMPHGLYSAVVQTVHHHKVEGERDFSYLLADTALVSHVLPYDQLVDFKLDLYGAGRILLHHPLLNFEDDGEAGVTVLERRFTTPQALVRLATLAELCDTLHKDDKRKGCLQINIELGRAQHQQLKLESVIKERDRNWVYTTQSTTLFDYRQRPLSLR